MYSKHIFITSFMLDYTFIFTNKQNKNKLYIFVLHGLINCIKTLIMLVSRIYLHMYIINNILYAYYV